MYERKGGVTYLKNVDGSSNPKYVDLLEEDKPISGQKFVCVSFVSPENILVQKNHFLFQEFLKHYDFSKSVEKFTQFLNFIAYKHNMEFDDLMKDFQEYVKSEGDSFPKNHVSDEYKSLWDKMWDSDIGKKVWTFDNKTHIYRKVFRVYN